MINNLVKHDALVSKADKQKSKNQTAVVVWFTGLSGSGKSTLANSLSQVMLENGYHCYLLDGDNIRLGLNSDLDFTDLGRKENIRRVAEVAKLFTDAGEIILTAFVSPFEDDRNQAKQIIGTENFIEVFVNTPLQECEARDTKGLYKRARKGEIKHFTGIDSPYEKPKNPSLVINTVNRSVAECTTEIYNFIQKRIIL